MAKLVHAVYYRDKSNRESYLSVNSGLREALQSLRDKSETKTYWIDQLSIKGILVRVYFQVSGMRHFYNRAQRVVIWTGQEDEYLKAAFDIIQKIAQASRVLGYIP